MTIHFDCMCPNCGARFGFDGAMTDKPPCPQCGERDDPADLAEQEEKMQEFKRQLFGDKLC